MIDLKLKTFYKLIETENMTKTAKLLNITQPGVSKQIKHLEEHFGVELIAKQGRKIKITEAGLILGEQIRKMMVLENQTHQKMIELSYLPKVYKIGATKTIGGYIVADLMKNYIEEHNCHLILNVDNTAEILNKLEDNSIDLALIEGLFDLKHYETKSFMKDELIYVTSPKNHKKEPCLLKDLLKDVLILREKGSGTRAIVEKALMEVNIECTNFKDYMEVGDITAIKSLITKGIGASFISRLSISKELESGQLCEQLISDFQIERNLYYVWKSSGNLKFVNSFINDN